MFNKYYLIAKKMNNGFAIDINKVLAAALLASTD